MVVIKPPLDNLGSRQRALNARVNEISSKNVPFATVKDEPETCEVDKLYKIDVAAKYKKLDYIIDILKTGNSLYTSRVLKKCQWLYEDDYSHITNPGYLQQNIFPYTSMQMKRKIIKAAATQVTNPKRAAVFFQYCMQEKMKGTAFTCLLYTTEKYKLDQLLNNKDPTFKTLEEKDILYFRLFVGKSFALLEALLNFISINWKISKTARQFRNFFSDSEDKYLDIVEKYVSTYYGIQTDKFDPKLSDAIMKRHKNRVLAKPEFYVYTVDTDVLVRNSNIDDVKIYAKVILPKTAHEFWSRHHNSIYRSIFKIIPHEKTYAFFKNYFAENYSGEEFETRVEFYEQEYYKYMTFEEKEKWANNHINSEKQMLGVGNDFLWYRFIKFDVAFEVIKKYINGTKEADKRNEMVKVLVESARNDRELEALFKYYSKRHMKESRKHKDSFFNKILSQHNVFEFDENCWAAFYALMQALDQSNKVDGYISDCSLENTRQYRTISVLYLILHDKELPEILNKFLLEEFRTEYIEIYLTDISDPQKQQKLHEYLFSFYMQEITEAKNKTFEHDDYTKKVEPSLKVYFENIDKSMRIFNEDGEVYDTTTANKSKKVRHIDPHEISGRSLLRDLKKDKDVVIHKLDKAKKKFRCSSQKVNSLLKKIKIYFPHDVREIYLEMFQELLKKKNAVDSGVNAIFYLADEDAKVDFMKKYRPVDTKAEKKELGDQHLRIQRAVCRYACLSQPPVPLSSMAMYMKGDSMKYCLHIFNTYLALLPLPMCQEFVHLVIDAPVSIQKHAIRMAFRCFNSDSLKEMITSIWKNTKNISLRAVIYKAFYNKTVDTEEKIFFDVLEGLTLDLNQDDDEAVFSLTVSESTKLPEEFLEGHIAALWTAVSKFKDVEPNITRKKNVICYMCEHINYMSDAIVSSVVNEHVKTMLYDNKFELTYSQENIAVLYNEKWDLLAHYLIFFPMYNPPDKYVQLAEFIIQKCILNWDRMFNNKYIYQTFCWQLFYKLKDISLEEDYGDFENAIPLFEGILNTVESNLQFYDSYIHIWELKLILIIANVIKRNRKHYSVDAESIITSIKEFGVEVTKLVSECVGSNNFFMSYAMKVKENLSHYLEKLLRVIYAEIDNKDQDWSSYMNRSLISVAAALTDVEIAETYFLAIHLVPTNGDECDSDMFKKLITKFEEFPNAEIQLTLYQTLQKYCNRKKAYPKSSDPCNIN